ncbi:MAG: ABC transporter permease [Firmicutes bacterium ZCTH02-B6]|nr:MAG: ABC transporter permease [Firmicutes bacterium ZCTH02-B6]
MVPLTVTATGEILSERAGVVNIGLEGILLISAFTAVIGAEAGGPLAGLMVGLLTGALLGLIHGIIAVYFRGDQTVSGVGLNILALGVVAIGIVDRWGAAGFHRVDRAFRVQPLSTPLGAMSPMVIVTILLAALTWYLLQHTNLGLKIQACGENPAAADAAGVRVERVRMFGAIYAGALTGLAGAYLSVDWLATITENLPAGRGFIALATVVFSRLNPWLAVVGGLIFGFFDALGLIASTSQELTRIIPYQFIQMMPYVVTLLVVAGVIGRFRSPSASGQAYRRE